MDLPSPTPPSPAGWYVIANPVAGGGRVRRRWRVLSAWLKSFLGESVLALTDRPGHATDMAIQAVADGWRNILAVGGDGTCHEVVNGLFRQRTVAPGAVTLALYPVGTGNDWIRTQGIPRRRKAWQRMFRQGYSRLQDVGQVRYTDEAGRPAERYFLNVAGMAFDAFVVRQIRQERRWTAAFYLLLILRHLMAFRAVEGVIHFDGQERRNRFVTIEAGIGRFAGGGLQLLPHAEPADGRLALMFAYDTSKFDILLNLYRFFDGSIGRHPRVELHQVESLRVAPAGNGIILLEADGEFLGSTPAEFHILPQTLRVLVPRT